MENSWCKVVNNKIIEGPRAWDNNIPPDDSWWPHILVDPEHVINDKFDGAVFLVDSENKRVVETNMYSPKSPEQIQSEIAYIKQMASKNIAKAIEVLEEESLENRQDWEEYKTAWEQMLNITELSWDHYMPLEP